VEPLQIATSRACPDLKAAHPEDLLWPRRTYRASAPIASPVRATNGCYQMHRTAMRVGGQGHALLVTARALARIAFPSGMNAGVPCEVLLWA
jgi:hypothetical protein